MNKLLVLSIVAMITGSSAVWADDSLEAQKQAIILNLNKAFPNEKIDSVKLSPFEGVYQVMIPPHVYYVNHDAKYIFSGDLFKLDGKVNLTKSLRDEARIKAIENVGEDSMIIFAPKKTRYTISVFTDIDCPYCKKLHSQMDGYNKQGIKVRYLAFPRGGPQSKSFDNTVSVWCAKDRNSAITKVKEGQAIANKKCNNPVLAHYNLGKKLGVQGTPAIILENGEILPGYVPPEKLIKILKEKLTKKQILNVTG